MNGQSNEEARQLKLQPELVPMHPLEHTWTFWVYRNKYNDFPRNLENLLDISTVEQFWSLYLRVKDCANLPCNWGYYFFKKDIHPTWEDMSNSAGGRWNINFQKNKKNSLIWREILLCLIGGHFEQYNDQVNGAYIVCKKANIRSGVWIRDFENKDACIDIGKLIKTRTNIPSLVCVSHDPNITKCYNL